ncbi:MAG: MBG domain-containing protein [Christensenellaceae bacterium]|jgi:hypothetical protein|nr:MBG domain-containing protein [Christensenellaceae bacterium]
MKKVIKRNLLVTVAVFIAAIAAMLVFAHGAKILNPDNPFFVSEDGKVALAAFPPAVWQTPDAGNSDMFFHTYNDGTVRNTEFNRHGVKDKYADIDHNGQYTSADAGYYADWGLTMLRRNSAAGAFTGLQFNNNTLSAAGIGDGITPVAQSGTVPSYTGVGDTRALYDYVVKSTGTATSYNATAKGAVTYQKAGGGSITAVSRIGLVEDEDFGLANNDLTSLNGAEYYGFNGIFTALMLPLRLGIGSAATEGGNANIPSSLALSTVKIPASYNISITNGGGAPFTVSYGMRWYLLDGPTVRSTSSNITNIAAGRTVGAGSTATFNADCILLPFFQGINDPHGYLEVFYVITGASGISATINSTDVMVDLDLSGDTAESKIGVRFDNFSGTNSVYATPLRNQAPSEPTGFTGAPGAKITVSGINRADSTVYSYGDQTVLSTPDGVGSKMYVKYGDTIRIALPLATKGTGNLTSFALTVSRNPADEFFKSLAYANFSTIFDYQNIVSNYSWGGTGGSAVQSPLLTQNLLRQYPGGETELYRTENSGMNSGYNSVYVPTDYAALLSPVMYNAFGGTDSSDWGGDLGIEISNELRAPVSKISEGLIFEEGSYAVWAYADFTVNGTFGSAITSENRNAFTINAFMPRGYEGGTLIGGNNQLTPSKASVPPMYFILDNDAPPVPVISQTSDLGSKILSGKWYVDKACPEIVLDGYSVGKSSINYLSSEKVYAFVSVADASRIELQEDFNLATDTKVIVSNEVNTMKQFIGNLTYNSSSDERLFENRGANSTGEATSMPNVLSMNPVPSYSDASETYNNKYSSTRGGTYSVFLYAVDEVGNYSVAKYTGDTGGLGNWKVDAATYTFDLRVQMNSENIYAGTDEENRIVRLENDYAGNFEFYVITGNYFSGDTCTLSMQTLASYPQFQNFSAGGGQGSVYQSATAGAKRGEKVCIRFALTTNTLTDTSFYATIGDSATPSSFMKWGLSGIYSERLAINRTEGTYFLNDFFSTGNSRRYYDVVFTMPDVLDEEYVEGNLRVVKPAIEYTVRRRADMQMNDTTTNSAYKRNAALQYTYNATSENHINTVDHMRILNDFYSPEVLNTTVNGVPFAAENRIAADESNTEVKYYNILSAELLMVSGGFILYGTDFLHTEHGSGAAIPAQSAMLPFTQAVANTYTVNTIFLYDKNTYSTKLYSSRKTDYDPLTEGHRYMVVGRSTPVGGNYSIQYIDLDEAAASSLPSEAGGYYYIARLSLENAERFAVSRGTYEIMKASAGVFSLAAENHSPEAGRTESYLGGVAAVYNLMFGEAFSAITFKQRTVENGGSEITTTGESSALVALTEVTFLKADGTAYGEEYDNGTIYFYRTSIDSGGSYLLGRFVVPEGTTTAGTHNINVTFMPIDLTKNPVTNELLTGTDGAAFIANNFDTFYSKYYAVSSDSYALKVHGFHSGNYDTVTKNIQIIVAPKPVFSIAANTNTSDIVYDGATHTTAYTVNTGVEGANLPTPAPLYYQITEDEAAAYINKYNELYTKFIAVGGPYYSETGDYIKNMYARTRAAENAFTLILGTGRVSVIPRTAGYYIAVIKSPAGYNYRYNFAEVFEIKKRGIIVGLPEQSVCDDLVSRVTDPETINPATQMPTEYGTYLMYAYGVIGEPVATFTTQGGSPLAQKPVLIYSLRRVSAQTHAAGEYIFEEQNILTLQGIDAGTYLIEVIVSDENNKGSITTIIHVSAALSHDYQVELPELVSLFPTYNLNSYIPQEQLGDNTTGHLIYGMSLKEAEQYILSGSQGFVKYLGGVINGKWTFENSDDVLNVKLHANGSGIVISQKRNIVWRAYDGDGNVNNNFEQYSYAVDIIVARNVLTAEGITLGEITYGAAVSTAAINGLLVPKTVYAAVPGYNLNQVNVPQDFTVQNGQGGYYGEAASSGFNIVWMDGANVPNAGSLNVEFRIILSTSGSASLDINNYYISQETLTRLLTVNRKQVSGYFNAVERDGETYYNQPVTTVFGTMVNPIYTVVVNGALYGQESFVYGEYGNPEAFNQVKIEYYDEGVQFVPSAYTVPKTYANSQTTYQIRISLSGNYVFGGSGIISASLTISQVADAELSVVKAGKNNAAVYGTPLSDVTFENSVTTKEAGVRIGTAYFYGTLVLKSGIDGTEVKNVGNYDIDYEFVPDDTLITLADGTILDYTYKYAFEKMRAEYEDDSETKNPYIITTNIAISKKEVTLGTVSPLIVTYNGNAQSPLFTAFDGNLDLTPYVSFVVTNRRNNTQLPFEVSSMLDAMRYDVHIELAESVQNYWGDLRIVYEITRKPITVTYNAADLEQEHADGFRGVAYTLSDEAARASAILYYYDINSARFEDSTLSVPGKYTTVVLFSGNYIFDGYYVSGQVGEKTTVYTYYYPTLMSVTNLQQQYGATVEPTVTFSYAGMTTPFKNYTVIYSGALPVNDITKINAAAYDVSIHTTFNGLDRIYTHVVSGENPTVYGAATIVLSVTPRPVTLIITPTATNDATHPFVYAFNGAGRTPLAYTGESGLQNLTNGGIKTDLNSAVTFRYKLNTVDAPLTATPPVDAGEYVLQVQSTDTNYVITQNGAQDGKYFTLIRINKAVLTGLIPPAIRTAYSYGESSSTIEFFAGGYAYYQNIFTGLTNVGSQGTWRINPAFEYLLFNAVPGGSPVYVPVQFVPATDNFVVYENVGVSVAVNKGDISDYLGVSETNLTLIYNSLAKTLTPSFNAALYVADRTNESGDAPGHTEAVVLSLAYNGSSIAPSNSGTYTLTVSVFQSAYYKGTKTLEVPLIIGKAEPQISGIQVALKPGTGYNGEALLAVGNTIIADLYVREGRSELPGFVSGITGDFIIYENNNLSAPYSNERPVSIMFVPLDSDNYVTVVRTVYANIPSRQNLVLGTNFNMPVVDSTKFTYGQRLSEAVLTATVGTPTVPVPGTFSWVEPNSVPAAGAHPLFRFTPSSEKLAAAVVINGTTYGTTLSYYDIYGVYEGPISSSFVVEFADLGVKSDTIAYGYDGELATDIDFSRVLFYNNSLYPDGTGEGITYFALEQSSFYKPTDESGQILRYDGNNDGAYDGIISSVMELVFTVNASNYNALPIFLANIKTENGIESPYEEGNGIKNPIAARIKLRLPADLYVLERDVFQYTAVHEYGGMDGLSAAELSEFLIDVGRAAIHAPAGYDDWNFQTRSAFKVLSIYHTSGEVSHVSKTGNYTAVVEYEDVRFFGRFTVAFSIAKEDVSGKIEFKQTDLITITGNEIYQTIGVVYGTIRSDTYDMKEIAGLGEVEFSFYYEDYAGGESAYGAISPRSTGMYRVTVSFSTDNAYGSRMFDYTVLPRAISVESVAPTYFFSYGEAVVSAFTSEIPLDYSALTVYYTDKGEYDAYQLRLNEGKTGAELGTLNFSATAPESVGSYTAYAVYSDGNYTATTQTFVITINPVATIFQQQPIVTGGKYGQTIGDSIVSGGSVINMVTRAVLTTDDYYYSFDNPLTLQNESETRFTQTGLVRVTVYAIPLNGNYLFSEYEVTINVSRGVVVIYAEITEVPYTGRGLPEPAVLFRTEPASNEGVSIGLRVDYWQGINRADPIAAGDYIADVYVLNENYEGHAQFPITILKATPTVTVAPGVAALRFNDSLLDAVFYGGRVAIEGGSDNIAGHFEYINNFIPPRAGYLPETNDEKTVYSYRFVPSDPNILSVVIDPVLHPELESVFAVIQKAFAEISVLNRQFYYGDRLDGGVTPITNPANLSYEWVLGYNFVDSNTEEAGFLFNFDSADRYAFRVGQRIYAIRVTDDNYEGEYYFEVSVSKRELIIDFTDAATGGNVTEYYMTYGNAARPGVSVHEASIASIDNLDKAAELTKVLVVKYVAADGSIYTYLPSAIGVYTVVIDVEDEHYDIAAGMSRKYTIGKGVVTLLEFDFSATQYYGSNTAPFINIAPLGVHYTIYYEDKETLPKSARSYSVRVLIDDPNYETKSAVGVYVVERKPVTITSISVENKRYDGNSTLSVTGVLAGIMPSDEVFLSLKARTKGGYSEPGEYNVEFVDVVLTGLSAANYVVSPPTYGRKIEILATEAVSPNGKGYLQSAAGSGFDSTFTVAIEEKYAEANKNNFITMFLGEKTVIINTTILSGGAPASLGGLTKFSILIPEEMRSSNNLRIEAVGELKSQGVTFTREGDYITYYATSGGNIAITRQNFPYWLVIAGGLVLILILGIIFVKIVMPTRVRKHLSRDVEIAMANQEVAPKSREERRADNIRRKQLVKYGTGLNSPFYNKDENN